MIEFVGCLALIAAHLSTWAEEWILWCTTEFGYLKLPDAYTTGSSIMPQKRNPDVLELVRGKSARVMAAVPHLLTLVKGLPLAYNRDLQEDKIALFDALDTIAACLELAPAIVGGAMLQRETNRRPAGRRLSRRDDADGIPDQEGSADADGPRNGRQAGGSLRREEMPAGRSVAGRPAGGLPADRRRRGAGAGGEERRGRPAELRIRRPRIGPRAIGNLEEEARRGWRDRRMKFTVDELLAFARLKKSEEWTTLCRKFPFELTFTESGGIDYIPVGGKINKVSRKKLDVWRDQQP